jgi:hypothetical protein
MAGKLIIAIVDNVAADLAGPLTLHGHDATAIRFFSDVATHPESQVGKHINDFDLVQLGFLTDELEIVPDKRVILTGSQWAAAQQARGDANNG